MVLQKPQQQDDRLPPPRTLILDFTLTRSSHVHTTGQLTNTRSSEDAPESDGVLRVVVRKKILHYPQLCINRPDPTVFLPVAVDTTGHIYDDFSRLLFLYPNREVSVLTNEIPEESDQFRFLRDVSLIILRVQWLILTKDSVISIPIDLSSRSFTPLPCFIRSRRPS